MIETRRLALVDGDLEPTGTYLGEASVVCSNCDRLISRRWNVSDFRVGGMSHLREEFARQENEACARLRQAHRSDDCGPRL